MSSEISNQNTLMRATTTTSRSSINRLLSTRKKQPQQPQLLQKPFNTRLDDGLVTLRYEDSLQAKLPIPVTVAPPRYPPQEQHPAFRRPVNGLQSTLEEDRKRDSGLAITTGSSRKAGSSFLTVDENAFGIVIDFDTNLTMAALQSPMMEQPKDARVVETSPMAKKNSNASESKWRLSGSRSRKNSGAKTPDDRVTTPEDFTPITTSIPTDSLLDDGFMDAMSFSKRGSMMFGGKKAVNRPQAREILGRSTSMLVSPTVQILSDDVEKESQKVRSMYERPNLDWEDGSLSTMTSQTNLGDGAIGTPQTTNSHLSPNPTWLDRPGSAFSSKSERREFELAGGIEDWEDVSGGDVDRYGFISIRPDPSRPGTPEPRMPQRVSTVLQLASAAPRKKRVFGRSPSSATSTSRGFNRAPSRKVSTRSLRTQGSTSSQRSNSRASLRAAANHLPGNRDRRWMDEAGDMLTLPPGLADIAEDEEGGKAAAGLKKKEFERTEKWRKMAKMVKTGKDGEGMHFEFDTKNPKLIERTWKGIPDRWRGEAWFSFLSTSAKKRKDSPDDESIISAFHKLLQTSSADDVQIDIDVPRTINSHIMFRRRYRGGQRLLFRVLHSLTLYFPDTGYVQGMASLAATLLCYYDEEKCFIMLVRLWTLRGLDKLYEAGFPGLMAALDEFQKCWLDQSNGEVAAKLNDLQIDTTAYGTRWYLTLFNYSIPFPAQLRVWDVFMLLGDEDTSLPITEERPFRGQLDVIHATSAALIDGTREILLDSDFENAMKVLTSWIPVKDEELLMKVAGAEWRGRRRRK